MGKHFDTLVDLIKDEMPKLLKNNPQELSKWRWLIQNAVLFEMPLRAQDIKPATGKDQEQYDKYFIEFFKMCEGYDKRILMPFNAMAVEDTDSVVFMDAVNKDTYRVASFARHGKPEFQTDFCNATTGIMQINMPTDKAMLPMAANNMLFYQFSDLGASVVPFWEMSGRHQDMVLHDYQTNAMSCIEQIIYIQDPENWIIRKENKQSQIFDAKSKERIKKDFLRKTIMRPHCVVLSDEDMKDMLSNEAKEPRPAHPVRGHWRKLLSERYVNMKGKTIFIEQYFTGQGKVDAKNGWTYQVMVKKGPDKLELYQQATE
jgi:hypothetical protein